MGYYLKMNPITEIIIEQGLANRFIKTSQLEKLLTGSPKRRYGLVNRAIRSGDLIQVQRGLYVLANKYRPSPYHPFALAQSLSPGSYISFETALAYHDWIPERVFTIASAVPGRKSRQYDNEKLGTYIFQPLATQPGYFLELVSRVQIDTQIMLVAKPCRALMDLICLRKMDWQGMGWLSKGLRIAPKHLKSISQGDIKMLQHVYKHKRVKSFLSSLSLELDLD